MRVKPAVSVFIMGVIAVLAVYLLLGRSNFNFGRAAQPETPQALGFTVYEDLLGAGSQDAQAWQDVAVMLRLQGQYSKAAQAYVKAGDYTATSNGQAQFYEIAGLMQIEASQGIVDREANLMFTKALASDPNTVDAQFYLGVSNQTSGQNEIALIHFRKFLEIARPRHPLIPDAAARIETLSQQARAPHRAANTLVGPQSIIDDFNALPETQKAQFIETLAVQKLNQLEATGGTAQDWADVADMFMRAGNPQKADYVRQKPIKVIDNKTE